MRKKRVKLRLFFKIRKLFLQLFVLDDIHCQYIMRNLKAQDIGLVRQPVASQVLQNTMYFVVFSGICS